MVSNIPNLIFNSFSTSPLLPVRSFRLWYIPRVRPARPPSNCFWGKPPDPWVMRTERFVSGTSRRRTRVCGPWELGRVRGRC
jgi:hypothetical protein